MLRYAPRNQWRCGMWNVGCQVLYRREKKELIYNTSIDCIKVRSNQDEYKYIQIYFSTFKIS
jgi:hypothetical protein